MDRKTAATLVREEHPPLASDDGYARAYDPDIWSRGQARSDFAARWDLPFLTVRTHIQHLRPVPEIAAVEAWTPCDASSSGAVKWIIAYQAQAHMPTEVVEDFINAHDDPGTLGIYTRT